MPEPLQVRRLWFRLRLDDEGVRINRKPVIPWDDVVAAGPQPTLALATLQLPLAFVWRSTWMPAPPVLHFCVRGDEYPRPARAVVFRWRTALQRSTRATTKHNDRDRAVIEELLRPWRDRGTKVVTTWDLRTWWYAQPESKPPQVKPPPPPPTTHERATQIGNDLHDLQDQLRRIQSREERNQPPA